MNRLLLMVAQQRGQHMADGLGDALGAIDNGWSVVGVFVLGLYGLLWRYGGLILTLVRENSIAAIELRKSHHKSTAEIEAQLDEVIDLLKPVVTDVAALKARVSDLEGGHDAGS